MIFFIIEQAYCGYYEAGVSEESERSYFLNI